MVIITRINLSNGNNYRNYIYFNYYSREIEVATIERPELIEFDKESEDDSLVDDQHHKLKNLLQENSDDAEIAWRFARACYRCSVKNPKKQKEFILEGKIQ